MDINVMDTVKGPDGKTYRVIEINGDDGLAIKGVTSNGAMNPGRKRQITWEEFERDYKKINLPPVTVTKLQTVVKEAKPEQIEEAAYKATYGSGSHDGRRPASKRKTIYISGPMTGLPEYNADMFSLFEKLLVPDFKVVNPSRFVLTDADGEIFLDHDEYMKIDMIALEKCDAIFMLPGWEKSKGACEEHAFAVDHGFSVMGFVCR